ncbi:photosystem II assembly protein [Scytonema sp. NUACC26]|uniref:photosystem II assembly protein n=1 Tax=Scytonema sp. NUACC26 TaxID=3140176 RepID=UPI0034DBE056
MNNKIVNWWRSQRFKLALQQGNKRLAMQFLEEIQASGVKLSWQEKLFRDKLQSESYLQQSKRETINLSAKLNEALQKLEKAELQEKFSQTQHNILTCDREFLTYINKVFQIVQHDENKIQCTGLDERIFDDFEVQLVEYLRDEFSKIPENKLLIKLEDALEDINCLKNGQDPNYNLSLTPHVYFMKYFLENVYCNYLAWFFVYEAGLLPTNIKILDVAAGPATVAYGLALFLQSTSGFFEIPPMHISYYSLEKQDTFQFRGLQFWRRYIESRKTSVNAYFRFVTDDLLTWNASSSNIPQDFFDFLVISHCFFSDVEKNNRAKSTYNQIIYSNLKTEGYAILIIQDKKLFKAYQTKQSEDYEQEKSLVKKFTNELGLELVWYKYLTSTDLRTPLGGAEFIKYAKEKLPKQMHMFSLLQQHFGQKYESNYVLDDYMILAKKA